jgi:hypothetical protein
MFAELDEAISPPPSAQQDSQGKLKGTGGGTTPSQPVAGMAVQDVLVLLWEYIKEEPEDANETDMCGFVWKSEEPIRFCWKTVEAGCSRCGTESHRMLEDVVKSHHLYIIAPVKRGPAVQAAFSRAFNRYDSGVGRDSSSAHRRCSEIRAPNGSASLQLSMTIPIGQPRTRLLRCGRRRECCLSLSLSQRGNLLRSPMRGSFLRLLPSLQRQRRAPRRTWRTSRTRSASSAGCWQWKRE